MSKPQVVNIQTKKPNWVNAIVSTLSQRVSSLMFGVSKDGKRNINDIYGYSEGMLTFSQKYWMWRRGGLAFRIVNGFARSCWRDGIKFLRDDEEVHEDEIKVLNKHGKLVKRLEQADILNRIGNFSVLFVGVPDGLDFDKPLGASRPDRLKEVYFRAYAEDGIQINSWITDVSSPRFGLPEIYQLTVESRGDKDTETITEPIKVHWTRIVHLAEGALDSDVEGVSCLDPIFNTLEDIVKTAGGSAEAYFRNARNRFSMETDPKYNAALSDADKVQLEEEAQRFQNDWQDFIRAGGIHIKPLTTPHNDPLNTFLVQLKILAGTTGYPIRILTGEGAGQLAGNEDKESYNQIVQDRRDVFCSEHVIRVFEILTEAKMMSLEDDDEITWPTPTVVSGKDKSTIASAYSTALTNVATALSSVGMDGVVDVQEVMELVFGEEAVADMNFEDFDDGLSPSELKEAEINKPAAPVIEVPEKKEEDE